MPEKDPKRRYATARDFADDLARWQRGEPVHARTLTLSYRAHKWARRNWRRAALVGLPFGLILGLATVLVMLIGSRMAGSSGSTVPSMGYVQATQPAPKPIPGPPPEAPAGSLAAKAQAILKTNCSRCHDGTGKDGAAFDVLRPDTMTGGKPAVIVWGKPDESLLIKRVSAGEMPPEGKSPRPSEEDIGVLRQWIERGRLPASSETNPLQP